MTVQTQTEELKKLKRQNTALKKSNTALSNRNIDLKARSDAEAKAQEIERATEPITEAKPTDGTQDVPPKMEVHSQGPGPGPVSGLAERAASQQQAAPPPQEVPPPPAVEQRVTPKARPTRRPLSRRDVLTFPPRAGYYRRIVNDTGDGRRVQAFKDAGYEIVKDGGLTGADGETGRPSQMGKNVTRVVGSDQQGAIKGVLMEIPLEFYNEDQAAKQTRITEMEDTINRTQKQKIEGSYGDGVQIKRPVG